MSKNGIYILFLGRSLWDIILAIFRLKTIDLLPHTHTFLNFFVTFTKNVCSSSERIEMVLFLSPKKVSIISYGFFLFVSVLLWLFIEGVLVGVFFLFSVLYFNHHTCHID